MTAFPTREFNKIKKVEDRKEKEKQMLNSVRDGLVEQIRKDISYLLKPRPFYLPFSVWIWVLSKLIKFDNKSLQEICLVSSSQKKTT
jgi:hypothetical protein